MKYVGIVVIIACLILCGCNNQPVVVSTPEERTDTNMTLQVEIKGAVLNPGIYMINSNTPIYELIRLAGGLLSNADTSNINQVLLVSDNTSISIPFKNGQASNTSLININRATEAELMEIPSIGSAKAKRIIAYRETAGPFSCIEDIMKVSGIGEDTFTKIKEYITV